MNDNHFDDYFIKWLIDLIKFKLLIYLNHEKLTQFNNDFNQKLELNKEIDIKKVVLVSINTLRYRKINNVYIIEIGNDKINYNGLNLNTICKLLNYGNTELKSFPIYSNVFNDIKSNIVEYYKQYLDE